METVDKTEIRREAREIADKVDAAPQEEKFRTFYDSLRAGQIPYLPCELDQDAEELFVRAYEAMYILGRASVPLTVGLTMHMYNLSALATLPVPTAPEFEMRRKILVDTIRKYRSLLAISSFGENIKSKDAPSRNVVVEQTPEGNFVCRGRKAFQSMASEADLLLFSGIIGEHMGMFYTSVKDQPALEVGPPLFGGAMSLTDTRPIEFKDLVIKRRNVLSVTDDLTDHVSFYATAWFEALVTAAYLGGACRALEEVRTFSRSVHTYEDETPLCELDGFVVDAGRLAIKLRSALAQARSFGTCAGRYCRRVREAAPAQELDELANDLMDCGAAVKYTATKSAVDVVNGARGLVGTRSMTPRHPIYSLSEQILFGPLHPTIPAMYERSAGSELLSEEPFLGLFEWGLG